MKTLSLSRLQSLTGTQLWLLGIAACLAALHLTLIYRSDNISAYALSLMGWLAVASLIRQQRETLNLNSSTLPSLLGLLLIGMVFLRSGFHPTSNFLGVSPFLSGVGLALIASGFKGFKQYWRELVILFFLGVPKTLIWPILDISGITARFATSLLWYTGFDVARDGFSVVLPGGAVNVNMGCSGLDSMFYLLCLAVMALLVYPLTGRKRWIVPLVAISLAFIVNGIRVVVMALFANAQDDAGLDYWHVGNGSLIFSLISVTLFGFFYLLLMRQETDAELDAEEAEAP